MNISQGDEKMERFMLQILSYSFVDGCSKKLRRQRNGSRFSKFACDSAESRSMGAG